MLTFPGKPLPKLLSLRQVCDILNVHPNTLRYWDKRSILRAVRFGLRQDRHYKQEDVLKLINSRIKEVSIEDRSNQEENLGIQMRLEQAKNALERISKLQLITAALSESLTPSEVIQVMMSQCTEMFGSDKAILLYINQETSSVHVLGSTNYSKTTITSWRNLTSLSNTPIDEVLSTKKAIFIESREKLKMFYPCLRELGLDENELSMAIIPLLNKRRITDILVLGYSKLFKFTKEGVSFILSLTSQCAQALHRSRIYKKEHDARTQAESTEEILEKIYISSLKFLDTLSLEKTFVTIVEEARKLVNAEYGSVLLAKDCELERVYASDNILYNIKARKHGHTYNAFCQQKAAVYRVKPKNDPHPLRAQLGIKSVIYIPLSYSGKPLGVLTVLSSKKENFSKQELEILQLFGAMASLAICKVKLYDEMKKALEMKVVYDQN